MDRLELGLNGRSNIIAKNIYWEIFDWIFISEQKRSRCRH
jgi:hypothetical protein